MYNYSENLRNELIDYFKEVHKTKIDHEKADMYLDSLADFCIHIMEE